MSSARKSSSPEPKMKCEEVILEDDNTFYDGCAANMQLQVAVNNNNCEITIRTTAADAATPTSADDTAVRDAPTRAEFVNVEEDVVQEVPEIFVCAKCALVLTNVQRKLTWRRCKSCGWWMCSLCKFNHCPCGGDRTRLNVKIPLPARCSGCFLPLKRQIKNCGWRPCKNCSAWQCGQCHRGEKCVCGTRDPLRCDRLPSTTSAKTRRRTADQLHRQQKRRRVLAESRQRVAMWLQQYEQQMLEHVGQEEVPQPILVEVSDDDDNNIPRESQAISRIRRRLQQSPEFLLPDIVDTVESQSYDAYLNVGEQPQYPTRLLQQQREEQMNHSVLHINQHNESPHQEAADEEHPLDLSARRVQGEQLDAAVDLSLPPVHAALDLSLPTRRRAQ